MHFPYEFLLPLIILLVLVIVLNVVLALLTPKKRGYQYSRKDYFMTHAEREFFKLLEAAIGGEFYIFPQVHLPSILDHKIKGQKWGGAFLHISQKSVDYILCNKETFAPILAIELDDWSHDREDRKERDKEVERILLEADIPLLRLRDYKKDSATIAQLVYEKISPKVEVS